MPGKVAAVIVAAGRGYRAGGDMPKQYRELAGEPVVTIEFHYMTEIDWLAGLSGRLSPVILGEELPSAADGRDQR